MRDKNVWVIPICFGLSMLLFLCGGLAVFQYLSLRASDKLLLALREVTPGSDITTIQQKIGHELSRNSVPDKMCKEGSVHDPSFCEGKELYVFGVSGLPNRGLDVYTYSNGTVAYVSWHYL